MRWRLWLTQSNTEGGINAALRVMAALSALWAIAAGYGSFAARRALQTSLTDAAAHRRQIEQTARDSRQKQASVALSKNLRVETPDGAGSPEGEEALGRLAQESSVRLEGLRMKTEDHPQAAPAANAPNAGMPNSATPPNGAAPSNGGNQGGGVVSGASAAAKDPDDGWKKSKIDCDALGSYSDLTAFLDRLDRTPYVIEIVRADMTGEPYHLKTDKASTRLKLTLMLYGLQKNSR